MAENDSTQASNRLWLRSTSLFLFLVGLALSVASMAVVLSMPELTWHPAQDAELRSMHESYGDSGAVAEGPSASPEGPTVEDDGDSPSPVGSGEPGPYLVALLLGRLTNADSPYPGLAVVQALLVALPMLWLPTAVARVFKRARAGYAMVLLPAVMWLVNNGTILVGTEYGLSDEVSVLRVPALYGLPASLAFLSLSLLLLFSTYRLSPVRLVGASLLVAVLAGLAGFSGVGAAIAVGVLWWLNPPTRGRWLRALVAGVVAVGLALAVHAGVVGAVSARPAASAQPVASEAAGYDVWRDLYLGLSYPEPINGEPSTFDVEWSEEAAWADAKAVDPEVEFGSQAHAAILRDGFLEQVSADPWTALHLYVLKALFVIKHFGAMLVFIVIGFVVALSRRSPQRRPLGAALAIAVPTLLLGFLPPVMGIPLLYFYSTLSAALGLLVAVSLGALVWSLTSMPAHVRASERMRLSGRLPVASPPANGGGGLSVIVPTRNGEQVIGETISTLASVLTPADEIVVVENGSTDRTSDVLDELSSSWASECRLVIRHSKPGLGEALRCGVLASTGGRLLLTADDLPFGFSDLDQFERLPRTVVVAVGSKAHPDSVVSRSPLRTLQSRIFRFLRAALLQSRVGDSQGTLWVDGAWGRAFALVSREVGLMWTTELVLAAEQQGIRVEEVPVSLADRHESGSSRFRFSDAWQSVVGFTRLAIYKDDYCNEDWVGPSFGPSAEDVLESHDGAESGEDALVPRDEALDAPETALGAR